MTKPSPGEEPSATQGSEGFSTETTGQYAAPVARIRSRRHQRPRTAGPIGEVQVRSVEEGHEWTLANAIQLIKDGYTVEHASKITNYPISLLRQRSGHGRR